MKARRRVGPEQVAKLDLRHSVDQTGECNGESRIALGVSVLRALATSACARMSRGPPRALLPGHFDANGSVAKCRPIAPPQGEGARSGSRGSSGARPRSPGVNPTLCWNWRMGSSPASPES
jgi:hypothetical protein